VVGRRCWLDDYMFVRLELCRWRRDQGDVYMYIVGGWVGLLLGIGYMGIW